MSRLRLPTEASMCPGPYVYVENKKMFNSLEILAGYCHRNSAIPQHGGVLMDRMAAQYWCGHWLLQTSCVAAKARPSAERTPASQYSYRWT